MIRLTRTGRRNPSRETKLLGAYGDRGILIFPVNFPCSADHEQDWQPYPVDPYSAICDDQSNIHTRCILPSIASQQKKIMYTLSSPPPPPPLRKNKQINASSGDRDQE